MFELVAVLKSDKYNEIVKLYRNNQTLDFYVERGNGGLRPFTFYAKSLSHRIREVDDWLHALVELGYEVLDIPFEKKTKEELMPIIKDMFDAMLNKSYDYYRKYAFVYFERYILDKHYLDWLFENFDEVRKQLKEVLP